MVTGTCPDLQSHCLFGVKVLGSARASRAGDGALAIANFSPEALRRGAAMSTRGACAPQTQIAAFRVILIASVLLRGGRAVPQIHREREIKSEGGKKEAAISLRETRCDSCGNQK